MRVCARAYVGACLCALHVNEVRTVCIFKLVGQRGGEKVTGNERCLTAVMLLMRVSPRSAPTGMELTSQSEISLKFYLSYLWAFAKCYLCTCRQSKCGIPMALCAAKLLLRQRCKVFLLYIHQLLNSS